MFKTGSVKDHSNNIFFCKYPSTPVSSHSVLPYTNLKVLKKTLIYVIGELHEALTVEREGKFLHICFKENEKNKTS